MIASIVELRAAIARLLRERVAPRSRGASWCKCVKFLRCNTLRRSEAKPRWAFSWDAALLRVRLSDGKTRQALTGSCDTLAVALSPGSGGG